MHQLIRTFALFTFLSITAHSAQSSMQDLYSDFQLTRIQLKSTKFNSQSFTSQFQAIDQQLQKKYEAYRKLQKENFTTEGNQMAYDIELIGPLRSLAATKLTKDDCQEALHDNELNYNDDDKQENALVRKIILTVCK